MSNYSNGFSKEISNDEWKEKSLKVCFVGDQLVSGVGDSKFLGWSGRLMQRTVINQAHIDRVEVYHLGKAGSTSDDISQRIESEAFPRFSISANNRLVIAMSSNDILAIHSSVSRLALPNALDKIANHPFKIETIVVGPPPGNTIQNNDISELNSAFKQVCDRRSVQYIDIFSPLNRNSQWIASSIATGEDYPDQVGYGLIAWVVQHSNWDNFIK